MQHTPAIIQSAGLATTVGKAGVIAQDTPVALQDTGRDQSGVAYRAELARLNDVCTAMQGS